MYFETISQHHIVTAESANEAAKLIKTGKGLHSNSVVQFPQDGLMIYVAPNGSLDSPYCEVALIAEYEGQFLMFESITAAWCDEAKLTEYFADTTGATDGRPVDIRKDEITDDKKAYFTCGCCGSRFFSGILYQKQFDQDTSYGICTKCEKYYR